MYDLVFQAKWENTQTATPVEACTPQRQKQRLNQEKQDKEQEQQQQKAGLEAAKKRENEVEK